MQNKLLLSLIPLSLLLFFGYFIYNDYTSYSPYIYYVIPFLIGVILIHLIISKISRSLSKSIDKIMAGITTIYITILTTQGKLSTFFDNDSIVGIIGNVIVNNILSILIFVTIGTLSALIIGIVKILFSTDKK